MAFCHVQWPSKVLGKEVGLYAILPDRGTPPYPVFYLLHGLSDDYTMWLRRTRIEWYVRQLPLIVVMPDGFRGFYTNHEDGGPAYASYMAEELPAFIERTFPARRDRAGRVVGGLSMGGYGALRLALGYPERYAAAVSHSGALMFGSFPANTDDPDRNREFRKIVGPDPAGSEHDLKVLARRALEAGTVPALRFDCGTDDFLLEHSRMFHAFLEELGVPHEYAEFPGAHTWDYWDIHVREALDFHCRHLGIEPVAD
jgi:S-formylglutathione hydrolase FrmB